MSPAVYKLSDTGLLCSFRRIGFCADQFTRFSGSGPTIIAEALLTVPQKQIKTVKLRGNPPLGTKQTRVVYDWLRRAGLGSPRNVPIFLDCMPHMYIQPPSMRTESGHAIEELRDMPSGYPDPDRQINRPWQWSNAKFKVLCIMTYYWPYPMCSKTSNSRLRTIRITGTSRRKALTSPK